MQLEECMGWTLQMVTKTVAAMAQTVFCADLQDNIELQSRLMQSVLEAEAERRGSLRCRAFPHDKSGT